LALLTRDCQLRYDGRMEKKLTERQEKILDIIIKEYVILAEPISSQALRKKHNLDISPATIRTEMQKLTDGGYLFQPHTSAGRVPTDRGYRFFVDKILGEEINDINTDDWFNEEFRDGIKFFQSLTKKMALESQSLVLGYLKDEDVFWKEGWEELFKEPEFENKETILNFTNFLEDFENNISVLEIDAGIKVYIGKESPFSKIQDFSIISTSAFAILGPKRMDYKKNINLLKSATRSNLWKKKKKK